MSVAVAVRADHDGDASKRRVVRRIDYIPHEKLLPAPRYARAVAAFLDERFGRVGGGEGTPSSAPVVLVWDLAG